MPTKCGACGSRCPTTHSAEHEALHRPGSHRGERAELPGKEFPATADPSPKTAFQGITLSPLLQTSSASPSKSLAWGHFYSNWSRADPWEHPGLEVGVFQVHSPWLLSALSVPSSDAEPLSLSAISLVSMVFAELWMLQGAVKPPLVTTKIKGDWGFLALL